MVLTLTETEARRILAALAKAEEWDDSDADSMTFCDWTAIRGFSRQRKRALRSAAATRRLREKIRGQLWPATLNPANGMDTIPGPQSEP